ncbi:hypothetical protein EDEG_02020 [Edhazardia aedis USNM 41457]|uniref:Uncharacterized protein n=1 Tax=Edhazardia aedis (strain USNM 41457) TaxID=1003232 RepID=J9D819_EDHAE|nr:hypothetical protein EDEG_02020 [Edhazardia aedis USNM 41457]|eukprot:EJW03649.1 hypothetical protein EDEG_02020 [Edhazardia aedis USNM 41457]
MNLIIFMWYAIPQGVSIIGFRNSVLIILSAFLFNSIIPVYSEQSFLFVYKIIQTIHTPSNFRSKLKFIMHKNIKTNITIYIILTLNRIQFYLTVLHYGNRCSLSFSAFNVFVNNFVH